MVSENQLCSIQYRNDFTTPFSACNIEEMAQIWHTNSLSMDGRDSMNQNLMNARSFERLLKNLSYCMIYFFMSSNKQVIPIWKYLLIQCRRIECTKNLLVIFANPKGPIMLRRNHYCGPNRCRLSTLPKIPPHPSQKICESITYEDDLVKFSWCYTQYFTRNRCAIFKPLLVCHIRGTTHKIFMPKKHNV